ncbi:hypothetical protein HWV62_38124, partial [Athelia sp. TMB]
RKGLSRVSATSLTSDQESVYETAAGIYVSDVATPPAPIAQPLFSEFTDLEPLISRMQKGSSDPTDYDAIQEVVYPTMHRPSRTDMASPTSPKTLLGPIEVERRRKAKDGRVRVKLSPLDAPVKKCGSCMAQFKSTELAAMRKICQHWRRAPDDDALGNVRAGNRRMTRRTAATGYAPFSAFPSLIAVLTRAAAGLIMFACFNLKRKKKKKPAKSTPEPLHARSQQPTPASLASPSHHRTLSATGQTPLSAPDSQSKPAAVHALDDIHSSTVTELSALEEPATDPPTPGQPSGTGTWPPTDSPPTAPEIETMSSPTDASSALVVFDRLFVTGYTEGNVFNIAGDFYEAANSPHALELLKLLDPVSMDATHRHQCLQGTRESILKSFVQDLTTPSPDTNIIWLTGLAGSGKSTIATTLAEHLHARGLLGAFLFFDRHSPSLSRPDMVIRTLAYQLAMSNQAFRDAVCEVIEQDPQIANRTLTHQFKELLLSPLGACSSRLSHPIVVVLDAFDECGDVHSRRALSYLFAEQLPLLPHNIRFLITGRPQLDLNNTFGSRLGVRSVSLNASEWASEADVLLYIQHELDTLYQARQASDQLPTGWPGASKIQLLGTRAADSFIYAATAIRYLYSSSDMDERLDSLLNQTAFTLEDLYATALWSASNWDPNEKATESCRKILGAVVVGRIGLTEDMIVDILGFERSKACRLVLRKLGCVLQWSEGLPVRTLHSTFADYLSDPDSCAGQPWFIDVAKYQMEFTVGCLRVMKQCLRFNICRLETSYVMNRDVPNLANRILDCIPRSLSYSCRFWSEHLSYTSGDKDGISSLVLDFCQVSFLYWLEVLSLIGQGRAALPAMATVEKHNMQHPQRDLRAFIKDSIKFIRAFASVISDSAPHIYISALPFSPSKSIVKQQYSSRISSTLCVKSGMRAQWPSCELVIEGHHGFVTSLTFSSDGERIASVSDDETIRVWDARTGELIVGPILGQPGSLTSVAFSPNGERIVSGSDYKTICIWDARTGELVAGPFEGHASDVTSVAFSPDGQRVASGSRDMTVQVWDVQSGELVTGTFQGHKNAVSSIAFSPDGERIASGSWDKTICVWDARKGALVAGPFEGHTHDVTSVAFSSDGGRIASASWDMSIRMWDAWTGDLVAGPFVGHTDVVNAVGFSPDGTRVASGSTDKTILVFDAWTGELVAGPFKGHGDSVCCVSFSPDGEHIMSGSWDMTIRIWDAWMSELDTGSLEEYPKDITSVAFSPGGEYIASASRDKTHHVWHAQTGELVSGPSQGLYNFVPSLAFSPDGEYIASGSRDSIYILDATTGELVAGPFAGHTDPITSLAFSPDGRYIVSGSHDKTVRVWDAQTGGLVCHPAEGHTNSVVTVDFSPDGERVASGSWDKTIRVWAAFTGVLIAGPFVGHTNIVTTVSFSSNGEYIASGSGDETIRIWDARTGNLFAGPFEGHAGVVNSVAFSPDGASIASGSSDNTIRIFSVQAYVGTSSDAGYRSTSRLVKGWMQNSPSELLFWVPPIYRAELWRPYSMLVIGQQTAKLDFSRFVHGSDWALCLDPPATTFRRHQIDKS